MRDKSNVELIKNLDTRKEKSDENFGFIWAYDVERTYEKLQPSLRENMVDVTRKCPINKPTHGPLVTDRSGLTDLTNNVTRGVKYIKIN